MRSWIVVSGCRAPSGRRSVGQRDVDGLLDSTRASRSASSSAWRAASAASTVRAGGADALPGGGLGGRRQRADLAVGQRERRAVAGVRQAGGLELVEVARPRRTRRARPRRRRRSPRAAARLTSTGSKFGLGMACASFVGARSDGRCDGASSGRRRQGGAWEAAASRARNRRTAHGRRDSVSVRPTRVGRRCARALAYRQTAAAAARFRLSARPWIGTADRRSAAASTSAGRPCASLPNSHSVGAARVPSSTRSSRSRAPAPAVARRVSPPRARPRPGRRGARVDAPGQVEQAAGAGPHRLAVVRVDAAGEDDGVGAGGVGGAHDRARRCPGRWARRAPRPARGARAEHGRRAATSIRAQTATRPCGVAVSDSAAASLALISADADAGQQVAVARSIASAVANSSSDGAGARSASRTACAPSARKRPASRRSLRLVSRRAAASRALVLS